MTSRLIKALLLFAVLGCNKDPNEPNNHIIGHGSVGGKTIWKYRYPDHPVTSAKVSIESASYIDSTNTDSEGQFRFDDLPTGIYTLKAMRYDYKPIDTTLNILNGDTLSINLELPFIYDIVLGTVLAGFQDTTSVQHTFQLCSSLGLTVKRLSGFSQQSNLPVDSLAFVRAALLPKSYLTVTNSTVYSYQGKIWIVGTFNNLDSAKIADWTQTQNQLQIASIPTAFRTGNIETQEGEEIYWVTMLKSHSCIDWLMLDYYVPAVLLK